MKSVSELSDVELRNELSHYNTKVGPILGTTRKIYEKKLEAFRTGTTLNKNKVKATKTSTPQKPTNESKQSITPVSLKKVYPSKNSLEMESDNEHESQNSHDDLEDSPTKSLYDASSPKNRQQPLRTPTPPRSTQKNRRTPLRSVERKMDIRKDIFADLDETFDSQKRSQNQNLPSQNTRSSYTSINQKTSTLQNNRPSTVLNHSAAMDEDEDDDIEDDHMESSKILAPDDRFDPFRQQPSKRFSTSYGSNFSSSSTNFPYRSSFGDSYGLNTGDSIGSYKVGPQKPVELHKSTPIEKIKNVFGFFSRPVNSGTPCTIDTSRYGVSTPKYLLNDTRRQSLNSSKYSALSMDKKKFKSNCDTSGVILVTMVSFLVVLGSAYFFTVNPKTLQSGFHFIRDFVSDGFYFFYNYAVLPLIFVAIVAGIVSGVYTLYNKRNYERSERKKRLMELVDKVTEIIRDTTSDGISEIHVRDILLPPTKRTPDDMKLWHEAAEFINEQDSRVRTESRVVNGIECSHWNWTPVTKQRWQGTAVAEGSPSINVPTNALARCIKLRGLNFSERASEKNEIRQELLNKLNPIVPLHIAFNNGPPENIVYLKLNSLKDAKTAFSTFHSNWYNGSLITAKYVREERYKERFPDA